MFFHHYLPVLLMVQCRRITVLSLLTITHGLSVARDHRGFGELFTRVELLLPELLTRVDCICGRVGETLSTTYFTRMYVQNCRFTYASTYGIHLNRRQVLKVLGVIYGVHRSTCTCSRCVSRVLSSITFKYRVNTNVVRIASVARRALIKTKLFQEKRINCK